MSRPIHVIRRAVGEALDYVDIIAQRGTFTVQPDTYDLARCSDYTTFNIEQDTNPEPNEVILDNFDEFRVAVSGFGRMLGIQVPDWHIDEDIRHEQAHCAAAMTVGFQRVILRLAFFAETPQSRGYRLYQQPVDPSRPVSKLALASIYAAPAVPSTGDSRRLADMGYRDLADIAKRIERNNMRSNRPALPRPLFHNLCAH